MSRPLPSPLPNSEKNFWRCIKALLLNKKCDWRTFRRTCYSKDVVCTSYAVLSASKKLCVFFSWTRCVTSKRLIVLWDHENLFIFARKASNFKIQYQKIYLQTYLDLLWNHAHSSQLPVSFCCSANKNASLEKNPADRLDCGDCVMRLRHAVWHFPEHFRSKKHNIIRQ